MKKIIFACVCSCMLFVLTACGTTSNASESLVSTFSTSISKKSEESQSSSNLVSSSSSSSSSLASTSSSKIDDVFDSSSDSHSSNVASSNSSSASSSSFETVKLGSYTIEKHGVPYILISSVDKSKINKVDYVSCKIATYNADGSKCDNEQSAEIGGRGNTTWTFDKKPYKIKFGSKISPLGLGEKAKKWVLLANMCDHSFIRNSLGLSFCNDIGGTNFVPKYKEVEVYFNGVYEGLYLLTEAVEMGDGRVEEEALIELSKNSNEVADALFKDSEGVQYEIKDYDKIDLKKAEIQTIFNNALASVKSGNQTNVEKLIDINSVIDAYIIEETLGNMDVGWDSFYFTIKNNKIYFGPLWDFDVSIGNGDDNSQNIQGFNAAENVGEVATSRSNLWFHYLSNQKWFREAVKTRWNSSTVQTALTNLKSNVLSFATSVEVARSVDFEKWTEFENNQIKKVNFENKDILAANTKEKQIQFVNEWISQRVKWLNENINSNNYINNNF